MRDLRAETLIIDCQVFQTIALHRGMGKYSMNFLMAVLPKLSKQGTTIVLLFNKNRSLEPDAKKQLETINAKVKFVYLELDTPEKSGYPKAISNNRQIIEDYVTAAYGTKPVSFMILSLFLGNAVASAFPASTYKIILFYDLIPLLYFRRYEKYVNFDEYLVHFRTTFESDMVLTISQTVADDMAIYLGFPESIMVNINGAAIDRSTIKPDPVVALQGKKIILMPTGDELRKNNYRSVEAFKKFNARHNGEYTLVLTSFFNPPTIEALQAISKDIVFTGNIKEEQLQWLYKKATLLLFATEYEGLGLPILEAMTVNKPILCSDIPVFREISDEAMYYFDPLDVDDIAVAIEDALNDPDFKDKAALYGDVLKRYTWDVSARVFLDAFKVSEATKPIIKKKLAIVAPDPSGFSAIGKVIAESHKAMAEFFDIDYYFDKGVYHKALRMDYLSWVAESHSIKDFNAKVYAQYDAVIYHVGNSDYHLQTILSALTLPGYVVFHDVYLEGAYEMLAAGDRMSPERLALEERLNALTGKTSSYITSLVSAQTGLIGHSEYAAKAIKAADREAIVKKVNLPVGKPEIQRNMYQARRHVTNVCFAGIIHEAKGTNIIKKLAQEVGNDDMRISVFGYDLGNQQLVEELGMLPNVELIQNPTDFEFQNLLAKQHILVNFRAKYNGETSLTVLEAMRYGVVSIVRRVGWYGELDPQAVVAVESEDEVYAQITRLHEDHKALKDISRHAHDYVQKNHGHAAYAASVNEFLAQSHPKNDTFRADVRAGLTPEDIIAKLR